MTTINTLLLFGGFLLLLGVLASTLSRRLGIPLLVLFLGLGMLAGEDGPGGIHFDSFGFAFFVSNLALAIILLDGGLRTQLKTFRIALAPAAVLATFGVAATAGILGIFATWLLDVDWRYGLLLGAIVGSTDAAAVFSLLRNSNVTLTSRVGATLEIESGTNDPMAIFAVTLLVEILTQEKSFTFLDMAEQFIKQFALGAAIGLVLGFLLMNLMKRLRLAEGLYAILVLSGGLLTFGLTNQMGGSGFLAIYLVGLCVGNARDRSAEPVLQVMDGMAWLSQATMFLVLGLLVTPSHIWKEIASASAIAGCLIFVARPVAVVISLLPFRYPWREQLFIAWVGLRGAVPIVLAVFPVMAGLPNSILLFDMTFVVVCLSLLLQGSTVPVVARTLGMLQPHAGAPLEEHRLWAGKRGMAVVAYRVEDGSFAEGRTPAEANLLGTNRQCVAIIRADRRMSVTTDIRLCAGDVIWLLLEEDACAAAPIFSKTGATKSRSESAEKL